MALALAMSVVSKATQACNSAKDATNKLIQATSDMNKTMTTEATKGSERPMVDIETLNKINSDTIQTLKSKFEIIREAKAIREKGIAQMKQNEIELKGELEKYYNMYLIED